MSTDKWEPIIVVLDCIQRYIPALNRVAAFTVGSELAAVNVGMAVCAMRAGILEDKACVALRTADFLVHAPQWITSLVVIELRICPDRLPTCVCVAVLARGGYRAMRVGHFRLRTANIWPRVRRQMLRLFCRLLRYQASAQCQEHNPDS